MKRPTNRIRIDGETAAVFIRRDGKRSLKMSIDAADLPLLAGRRIVGIPNSNEPGRVYAAFRATDESGRRRTVRVHRFLTDCPEELVVDHVNHKTLDNRRSNLRIVTQGENAFNVSVSRRNRTSGVRGVCPSKRGRWRVRFQKGGVRVCLGASFVSVEEAERVAVQYLEAQYLGRRMAA